MNVLENNNQPLFICSGGEALPRWSEAFPRAICADLNTLQPLDFVQPTLIWLRPNGNGQAGAQVAMVRNQFGSVPVVVLSDEPKDDEAASVFAAGAKGYCNTHAASELLQQIASVVAQGGLWVGEGLMLRLLSLTNHMPKASSESRAWEQALSDREREVARELSVGASNKEIARRLGITERTVKMHVGSIFTKLKVRDRLQLSILLRS